MPALIYISVLDLYLNGMRNIMEFGLKKKNPQFTLQLDCPTQTPLSEH